jgi:hypothetical protein
MPLAEGSVTQAPFTMRLEAVDDGVGDWRLHHDPRGGFAAMSFRDAPATMADFAATNEVISTSPESKFVKVMTAQRRTEDRVQVVRGLVWEEITADGREERELTERDDWFGVLGDVFGLRFADVDPAALDELWARWSDKHRRWRERQGQPADCARRRLAARAPPMPTAMPNAAPPRPRARWLGDMCSWLPMPPSRSAASAPPLARNHPGVVGEPVQPARRSIPPTRASR